VPYTSSTRRETVAQSYRSTHSSAWGTPVVRPAGERGEEDAGEIPGVADGERQPRGAVGDHGPEGGDAGGDDEGTARHGLDEDDLPKDSPPVWGAT
jgi:hypothetical protein